MPKERITGDLSNDPYRMYDTFVAWGPSHSNVGVGVGTPDGVTLPWKLWGTKESKLALGAFLRELDFSQGDEKLAEDVLNQIDTLGCFSSVWSDLTREGCNRLIRTVRRARDTVFGRDE